MGDGAEARWRTALLLAALTGVGAGLALGGARAHRTANIAWAAGAVPVLAALLFEIQRSLRRGEVGLDLLAAMSISAALFFGETLAAAVVAVMYSGGTFLESFAHGRARREMQGLLSRVPRTTRWGQAKAVSTPRLGRARRTASR